MEECRLYKVIGIAHDNICLLPEGEKYPEIVFFNKGESLFDILPGHMVAAKTKCKLVPLSSKLKKLYDKVKGDLPEADAGIRRELIALHRMPSRCVCQISEDGGVRFI